jgi:hypothetical protein
MLNLIAEAEFAGLLLHEYLRFRAEYEGQAYGLDARWFAERYSKGARSFFGVVVEDGEPIRDEHLPELFEDWCQTFEAKPPMRLH